MQPTASPWQPVGVVVEGDAIDVGGVNPWAHKWHRVTAAAVDLPHPAYPNQTHRFVVYQVTTNGLSVTFAAGELSANVWGFYVPAA